jgi:hypothetical protein
MTLFTLLDFRDRVAGKLRRERIVSSIQWQNLQWQQIIGAIVGLGIAAFGLLEASKSLFDGICRIGFSHIRKTVISLTPEGGTSSITLPQADILKSLEANWSNGIDLASQKAIAHSLVIMHLSPATSAALATRTRVDPTLLLAIVTKIYSGIVFNPMESDTYARFDFILTALLDEAYQNSDRVYRNGMRTLVTAVAVALAEAGVFTLEGAHIFLSSTDPYIAFLLGLLAAPIAPLAKDVSTAVGSAIKSKIRSAL